MNKTPKTTELLNRHTYGSAIWCSKAVDLLFDLETRLSDMEAHQKAHDEAHQSDNRQITTDLPQK